MIPDRPFSMKPRRLPAHSRSLLRKIPCLFVLFSLLLCSCRPAGGTAAAAAATTAAAFAEETVSEAFTGQLRLSEQARFAAFEEELFVSELSDSRIDLHFLIRHPENYGLSTTDALYADFSLAALEEAGAEQRALAERLKSFNPALLTDEQLLTLRILQDLMETEAMCHGLELYCQPLSPTTGVQAELPVLLCEYAFYEEKDVGEYLELLEGLDEYFQQILGFEKEKAAAGLMMSDDTIDHVIESCDSWLAAQKNGLLTESFDERLSGLSGIDAQSAAQYRSRNEAAIAEHFVPAYELLIAGLKELKGTGTNPGGLSGFPEGKAWYEYLVFSSTGTSYRSVDELLEIVEGAVREYLAAAWAILDDSPELAGSLDDFSFGGTDPAAIMEALKAASAAEFAPLPECTYTIKTVADALQDVLSPAFYLTSPIDDISANVIYINPADAGGAQTLCSTLAHEGYPGHLYQTVWFHTYTDSPLRHILAFEGYSEGWATYVENLSYTMGSNLDREAGAVLAAESMAVLGMHAYLDLTVNYLGWDADDVADYLANFYEDPEELAEVMFSAMVDSPASYLSYFVGCLEITNMRTIAERTLGKDFDAINFHRFLMDIGEAPFTVIQPYFTAWLAAQQ